MTQITERPCALPLLASALDAAHLPTAELLVLSEETMISLTGSAVLDVSRKRLFSRGASAVCVLLSHGGYCLMTESEIVCEGGARQDSPSGDISPEERVARAVTQLMRRGVGVRRALHQAGNGYGSK